MNDRVPDDVIAAFKALAEGAIEPQQWLSWWNENAQRIQLMVSPGLFLRMKPRGADQGVFQAASSSQVGACEVLDKLGVKYARSERYHEAAVQRRQEAIGRIQAENKARSKAFKPAFDALKTEFPKFARFLARHTDNVESVRGPMSPEEIKQCEERLAVTLPLGYRNFLVCIRELDLEVLRFGPEHPFVMPSLAPSVEEGRWLCIADFSLEADGDQVVMDLASQEQDPPVFYYCHENHKSPFRKLAPTFTDWVEHLGGSPAFAEWD